jgi:hypothetical protein
MPMRLMEISGVQCGTYVGYNEIFLQTGIFDKYRGMEGQEDDGLP